jgi:hypothetical protein
MFRILFAALIVLCFSFQTIADQSLSLNCPLEVKDVKITLSALTKVQSSMDSMGSMGSGMGMSGMGSMSSSGDTGTKSPMSANSEQRLIFIMKSKNLSTQAISNIYWQSCFTTANKETVVKQFKTSKKIKSNSEETIKEAISLDNKSAPATNKIGILISKIEYEDKTVWENKTQTGENAFVFVEVKFEK